MSGKAVKDYLSFGSLSELIAWYVKRKPSDPYVPGGRRIVGRSVYEILRETKPICVGFDLECDSTDERHRKVAAAQGLSSDPNTFLAQITERIVAVFPQLANSPALVSTSHKPGIKISFHIKYSGHYLADMDTRDTFKRAIKQKLGDLLPCLDDSVYSQRKNMRMLWSHKYGDDSRPLVPVGDATVMDPATIKAHMWTYVPDDAQPLDLSVFLVTSAVRRQPVHQAGDGALKRKRDQSGASYAAYIAWVGDVGEPQHADGNGLVHWTTTKEHTCCHGFPQSVGGDTWRTKVFDDAILLRACLGDECRFTLNGHEGSRLDWRVVGLLNGTAPLEGCPLDESLTMWPLPRHFYYYENTLQRELGADVRCLAERQTGTGGSIGACPPGGPAGIIHQWLVQHTNEAGIVVRCVVGLSMNAELWVRRGAPYGAGMPAPYEVLRMGNSPDEHARLDHWWRVAWKARFAELEATECEQRWFGRYRWDIGPVLGRIQACRPWMQLQKACALCEM